MRTENNSTVELGYVALEVERDSDGDGLTNSQEQMGFRACWDERVYIDPYSSDTDGDGLSDGEEVKRFVQDATLAGGCYLLHSNPAVPDTDSDGLDDASERAWNTGPFDTDTDSDGYLDLVDRRVHVEDVAPDVQIISADRNRVELAVKDEQGIKNVNLDAYFDTWLDGEFWKQGRILHYSDGINREHYILDVPRSSAVKLPELYVVNVTDSNNNTATYLYSTTGGGTTLEAALVAGGTTGTAQGGATKTLEVGGRTIGYTGRFSGLTQGVKTISSAVSVVMLSAIVYEHTTTTYEGGSVTGTSSLSSVPASGLVEEYPPPVSPFGRPLSLPSGTTYEAPVGIGDQYDRRYGWEQVRRLPGIVSPGDVGDVLRHPSPRYVGGDGPYSVYIGENPNSDGKIILRLLGHSIVGAAQAATDPQGRDVEITEDVIEKLVYEKDDWDHNQVGQTEEEVRRNLREIIEKPTEIYKEPGQDRWMYVKRMVVNGRAVIFTLFVFNGRVVTAFAPTHGEINGPAGHFSEYVKWYIAIQQMQKKYENPNEDAVLPEVNEGETPQHPGEKPEP